MLPFPQQQQKQHASTRSLMDNMTRSVRSVWTRPIDAKAIFHSESRDCVENARLIRCWSPSIGIGEITCICFLLEASVRIDMNKLWFEHAQMVEEIDFFLCVEVAQ